MSGASKEKKTDRHTHRQRKRKRSTVDSDQRGKKLYNAKGII